MDAVNALRGARPGGPGDDQAVRRIAARLVQGVYATLCRIPEDNRRRLLHDIQDCAITRSEEATRPKQVTPPAADKAIGGNADGLFETVP